LPPLPFDPPIARSARRSARQLARLAAGLWLVAAAVGWAQEQAPPLSEQEWDKALATIRAIALDPGEAAEHRANAVKAGAKALLWKGRHDDAMKFCLDVLKAGGEATVVDAALRAGCLVERSRCGHLRGEADFLATASAGAAAPAAAAIRQELKRMTAGLDLLAATPMVPGRVVPAFPHWAAAGPGQAPGVLHFAALSAPAPGWYPAPGTTPGAFRVALPEIAPPPWYRFQPGQAHPALHVTHPKMEPPQWYGGVAFPRLKETPK